MEQTNTIFIWTIIVLVSTLSLVAYILSVTKKTYKFPPQINSCPDYFHINSYGDCYDKNKVFNEDDNICFSENFNKVIYNNSGTGTESGLCKKKTWANKCKVTWDGITNNSQLCI